FQAEDGIRDFHVTGVQTCALPIWRTAARGRIGAVGRVRIVDVQAQPIGAVGIRVVDRIAPLGRALVAFEALVAAWFRAELQAGEIGRAACSERVASAAAARLRDGN